MSDAEQKTPAPGPLQRLIASLLGLLQSHIGVFGIELEEARDRLARTLVLLIVGAGSILLFLLTLALALVLMIDPAHRLYAVIGLLVFFVVLAIACLGIAWNRMKNGPEPFALTLDELRKDRERLLP